MPTPAEVVCSRLLRICDRCERENPIPRHFCGECGAAVVAFCSRCHFANDFDDRFCGRCALDLESVATARPSQAAVAGAADLGTSRAAPGSTPPPPIPERPTGGPRARMRRPSASVLARRLIALNRDKVAPVDAVDLTSEVHEETDEMGQDQIDALFNR